MNIYLESIRRTEARLKRQVCIGRGVHTGQLHFLTPEQYRDTHTHVIGPPGMGKSKQVRGMLAGFSDVGIPTHLLESHGEECSQYLQFLRNNPRLVREGRILHFKPGSDADPIGINPFASSLPPADIASLVLDALMKVWGAESFNDAPRMQRILRNIFHMAAVHKLWWEDVFPLLLPSNKALRLNLLQGVSDPTVRQDCIDFEALPFSIKQERFESSSNRIQKIICATSATAKAFRRQPKILDIRTMLRLKQSSVSDLSILGSPEAEALIGAIMVNTWYHAVKNRPKSQRYFTVFAIDEFPQFVTTDIARSLDQFRKFGVHLILAHQRLGQLSADLQNAVISCAKIKFVFGGLCYEEAATFTRELFAGEVRGDRPKHITYQTKFRPVLEEREVEGWSETVSESDSESDGWSDGHSYGSSTNEADSRTERELDGTIDDADATITHALSSSSSSTTATGRSGARNRGTSQSRGHSRGFTFVTNHEEFREETSRQFWSCDEQWEMLTARTMNLDKREVLVKVYNQPVLDIRTPDVEIKPTFRRRRTARQRRLEQLRRMSLEESNGTTTEGTILPPMQKGGLPEDFRE